MAYTTVTRPATYNLCIVQYFNFFAIFSFTNASILGVLRVIPKGAPNNFEMAPGGAQVISKFFSQAGFDEEVNQYPTLLGHLMRRPEAEPNYLSKSMVWYKYVSKP